MPTNHGEPEGPPTIITEPMIVLHEADRDIEAGRVKRFDSAEELLRELAVVIPRYLPEHSPFATFTPTDEELKAFLDNVYSYQVAGEIRPGIGYVFANLNGFLANGDVATCDRVLCMVDVERLKTDLLLSFLTITFTGRDRLAARNSYYARAKKRIRKDVGWPEAYRLLSALK